MPTLLVLRHGKSDWDADHADDADRPLAERGRRAAATIGRHLADVGPQPALALTSPAVRAHDTLRRVLDAGRFDCPARVVSAFYGHGTRPVLDELRALEAAAGPVLVVGHEPTWSDLIATLTGTAVRFPTAALARIDLSGPWSDIGAGAGVLTWLVLPRELEPRGAICVEIELGGRCFQVINTHLSLSPRERRIQAEALLGPEWLGHPDCRAPRVLCGDFNAAPWFPVSKEPPPAR